MCRPPVVVVVVVDLSVPSGPMFSFVSAPALCGSDGETTLEEAVLSLEASRAEARQMMLFVLPTSGVPTDPLRCGAR